MIKWMEGHQKDIRAENYVGAVDAMKSDGLSLGGIGKSYSTLNFHRR